MSPSLRVAVRATGPPDGVVAPTEPVARAVGGGVDDDGGCGDAERFREGESGGTAARGVADGALLGDADRFAEGGAGFVGSARADVGASGSARSRTG
ncbi:hypothetical protein [Streptomyces sp. NPDC003006]